MTLAAGYQHFADGPSFAEIVLRHPAVREVYFPWPEEPSGRPRLGYGEEEDPATLARALRADLERLRAAGVKLDLLLNANCYGSQAMSVALEDHVRDILGKLDHCGLLPETVTAASPFITRTKHFPGVELRASVNMRLTTVQAMAYLAPLFDSFYLGRDVQRNLGAVRAARAWCDAHGKKLCILANSGCLRNCPWQTFHDNLVAHSSAALKRVNVKGWSPHLCWSERVEPASLLDPLPGRGELPRNSQGDVDPSRGHPPLRRARGRGEARHAPARESGYGDRRVRAAVVRRQPARPPRARLLAVLLSEVH